MIYVGHVTVWGIGEAYTGLWWGDLRESEHLGDAGEGGGYYLVGSSGNTMWDKDWLDLAQDRNSWLALANAVMNFGIT